MTCDGMDTTLVPAADFGVPTASMITVSSSMEAGRISRARGVLAAPRI